MEKRISEARLIKADILKAMAGQDWITARNRILVTRILDGQTYLQAGAEFGLSHEGVRQACFKIFRKLGFKV